MSEPDNSDLVDHAGFLTPKDQVALWAGRILRKEAEIEHMLRHVHHRLSGDGLSWSVVPQNFAPLTRDIRTMLKAAQLEDDTYLKDCLAALDRLDAAHRVRNRVVHDFWVEHHEEPGRFVKAQKGVAGPGAGIEVIWDVAEFANCYRELRFCAAMIGGMFWSIDCFVGDNTDFFREMLPSNREALAGRIVLIGENHQEFTDKNFAARLRAEMQASSEELRARIRELLPNPED